MRKRNWLVEDNLVALYVALHEYKDIRFTLEDIKEIIPLKGFSMRIQNYIAIDTDGEKGLDAALESPLFNELYGIFKDLSQTPPSDLAGAKLTELLNTNKVRISVDSKYPQAIGISQIFYYTSFFGNSIWEVLHNDIIDSPFFTSDYPVAIEMTKDPRILNKIIPLSPNLAIRILPDPNFVREKPDFTFSRFASRNKSLKRKEVITINKLIVQCAESLVFYRDHHDWVYKVVAKNSKFRIEPYTTKMKTNNSTLMVFTPRIGEKGTASKD